MSDHFINVFTTLLDLECGNLVAIEAKKNTSICVSKMNANLTDLDRHEGE